MATVTGFGAAVQEAGAARWVPVERTVGVLAGSVTATVACTEAEVTAGLAVLDRVHAQAQWCVLAVAVEAHRRGLHLDTGLSVRDWVAQRCRGMSRAQVGELASVVTAWDHPGHRVLREAVTCGDVSVGRAAKLVRALARVAPVTDAGTYADVVALLTPVAAEGSERDLRQVTDHVVAVALSDQETEDQGQGVS